MSDLQNELADLIRQHLPVDHLEQNGDQSVDDHQRQAIQNVFVDAIAASILEKFDVRQKGQPQATNETSPLPSPRKYRRVSRVVFPFDPDGNKTVVYTFDSEGRRIS